MGEKEILHLQSIRLLLQSKRQILKVLNEDRRKVNQDRLNREIHDKE